jgi:hypothetical protein
VDSIDQMKKEATKHLKTGKDEILRNILYKVCCLVASFISRLKVSLKTKRRGSPHNPVKLGGIVIFSYHIYSYYRVTAHPIFSRIPLFPQEL